MTVRQENVTIHNVAKIAGVSISTVSRVVNDLDRVAPSTRQKVEKAIRKLGFRPNSRAQALSRKRTDTIGLIVPDFFGQYFAMLMEGAHEEAQSNGVHIMVLKAKSPEEKQEALDRLCTEGRADGVILMLSELYPQVLEVAGEISTPLVILDKDIKGFRYDNILLDNQLAAYEAARHFLEVHDVNGLFFVGGSKSNVDSIARARGVSEAIETLKPHVEGGQFFGHGYSYEEGHRIARQDVLPRIEAGRTYGIVAANDDVACGAIDALLDHDIEVPRQVGVIGFDDSYIASHRRLKITTLRVPTKEIGRVAVRMILDRLAGKIHEPAKILLKAQLIVRESCGCNEKKTKSLNP
jgi:LacI family transcriptional regulator